VFSPDKRTARNIRKRDIFILESSIKNKANKYFKSQWTHMYKCKDKHQASKDDDKDKD